MVENQFSPKLLDEIIVECGLASDGAYTAVGTYDHDELIQMVAPLQISSTQDNVPSFYW